MSGRHDHGVPELATSPAIRRVVLLVLVPLLLATVAGLLLLWPGEDGPSIDERDLFDATLLSSRTCELSEQVAQQNTQGGHLHGGAASGPDPGDCRVGRVLLTEGADADRELDVVLPGGPSVPEFADGDALVLAGVPDLPPEQRYRVVDEQRDVPLLLLAIAFAVAVVALARWRGVAALVGLVVTVVVLTTFLLPALLQGSNPLAVAVVGASVMMVATLYLCHGFSIRTSVALLGTLVSLTLTGLLGFAMIGFAGFSGLADEEAAHVTGLGLDIDLRGLLLAGLVIGALGVLDDVTVTQTAAVWEIAAADPEMSRTRLLLAGLRVGRDHVAATVNTLVLAYAGASLPLLMLFTVVGRSATDVVTSEIVATELVRALVGGLGIVAAVPVTTGLAAVAVRSGDLTATGPIDPGSGAGSAGRSGAGAGGRAGARTPAPPSARARQRRRS